MKASSSANQMEPACPLHGSVMVMQTVRIAQMSIMGVPHAHALPHSFAATTATVCIAAGYVMGIMTAAMAVMSVTALRHHSAAPAGSFSALATQCVSISPKCVIIHLTAQTELTSPHSAVSDYFCILKRNA